MQKSKETVVNLQYIYQNELDKACFQHDMAYGDFKDLTGRTASDKILRHKAFSVAKNSKYDGYENGLASMVSNCLYKKSAFGGAVKNEIMINQELAEQLYNPMENHRNLKKRKVYSSFIDKVWGTDLADMQLISQFNHRFYFTICY